jgi:LPPG:FO 2-phospho-L-lactate transferase
VLEALHTADAVVLPPSNPVVSVGTILGVPGIGDAVRSRPVVGVSPIVGDAPVRGMADACLSAIGVETSAVGVARHYGSRAAGGLLDAWVLDESDAARVPEVEALGIRAVAVPALMRDVATAAALAASVLAVVDEVTP